MVDGRLLDLRKRSIVSLGAKLRGPGVVHDMRTRIWVDTESLAIARVDAEMNAFPYVESPETGGETCPGRLADVQSVVGMRLSGSYTEDLNALIGGPLGCFHIFTLLRLTGPALVAALADTGLRARMAEPPYPAVGETLWSRCVSVDSLKGDGLALVLHGTLTDTFQRGGPVESGAGAEELVRGVEVMADLETSFPEMALADVNGRRRSLAPGPGAAEPWVPVKNFSQLQGVSVRKGFSSKVQAILDDPAGLRPESHLIFMMAPVVMQSLPGLLEEMEIRRSSGRSGSGGGGSSVGTAVNSCHIWRSHGPLDRLTSSLTASTGKREG